MVATMTKQIMVEIERRIAAKVSTALEDVPELTGRISHGVGVDERPARPRSVCQAYVGFTRSSGAVMGEGVFMETMQFDVRLEMQGLSAATRIKNASDAVVIALRSAYVSHPWASMLRFVGRDEVGFADKDGCWIYSHTYELDFNWGDSDVPDFCCDCDLARYPIDGLEIRTGLWRSPIPLNLPTSELESVINIRVTPES